MMESYHRTNTAQSGKNPTHSSTWIPFRAWKIVECLRRLLGVDQPGRISNARVALALGYSEAEFSQALRWLSGESAGINGQPFGYTYLQNAPTYRHIRRERTPSGAYVTTVLARPEPIALEKDPIQDPFFVKPRAGEMGSLGEDPICSACGSRLDAAERPAGRDLPLDHESTQEVVVVTAPRKKNEQTGAIESTLRDLGVFPPVIRRITHVFPDLTISAIHEDLAHARQQPRNQSALAVAATCWQAGERVSPPSAAEESPDERRCDTPRGTADRTERPRSGRVDVHRPHPARQTRFAATRGLYSTRADPHGGHIDDEFYARILRSIGYTDEAELPHV